MRGLGLAHGLEAALVAALVLLLRHKERLGALGAMASMISDSAPSSQDTKSSSSSTKLEKDLEPDCWLLKNDSGEQEGKVKLRKDDCRLGMADGDVGPDIACCISKLILSDGDIGSWIVFPRRGQDWADCAGCG